MPDERARGMSQKCGKQFEKNSQYFTRRNLSRDLQCPQKMFAILAIFSNNSLAFYVYKLEIIFKCVAKFFCRALELKEGRNVEVLFR